jgi:carboxypeptidase family protein
MRRLACVIVGLLAMPGCDFTCRALCVIAVGLDVGVANAATGAPICDATVTAIDGSYSEELQPTTDGRGCRFWGASSRPGIYSVRAERQGFLPMTLSRVKVGAGKGGCCPGLETAHREIRLPPAP